MLLHVCTAKMCVIHSVDVFSTVLAGSNWLTHSTPIQLKCLYAPLNLLVWTQVVAR